MIYFVIEQMKNSFFINENQLIEWVEAAEDIKERFGINKAVGYLIGEKFCNIVSILYSNRKGINRIDEQRKKTNNKSIQENGFGKNKSAKDLDNEYKKRTERMNAAKEVLNEFLKLIRKTFEEMKYGNPLILILDLAHSAMYFQKNNINFGL